MQSGLQETCGLDMEGARADPAVQPFTFHSLLQPLIYDLCDFSL
jgi:hypothetical protein